MSALGLSSVWVDPELKADLAEAGKSDEHGVDYYQELLLDWQVAVAKAQYASQMLPPPAGDLLSAALFEIVEEVLRMSIERAVFKTIIKPTNL